MKLTSLVKLLNGEMAPADYGRELESELAIHVGALAKKGSSTPVAVTEDSSLEFGQPQLATLCRLYAAGALSAAQLAYTADVIQLSENVHIVGESVAEDLAGCTDPEINGPLSPAEALAMAGR
ncbi:hypothetical protein K7B09_12520 [Thermomonas sp. RSS23]|uniref:Uncharacterized protein n=1 Tax=Thermomonas beijingensis TaxID=2872701 RepID=A0ABS7TH05_9GAMM|nr:hypothetical protein [Thermomonas beijingensis]MBZ4187145.1 hypothetical protein [Thermomonas beijingensis]